MPLPKISHPTFDMTVPSTGKKVQFRPFTGREQKILLIAKESDDPKDALRAVAQIIESCFPGVSGQDVPIFDLEYMFLQLRAKSVSNKIELRIEDEDDGQTYDATADLDAVEIVKPEGWDDNVVKITDSIGMKLKYPTVRSVLSGSKDMDQWDILASSVDSIYEGDTVTSSKEVTVQELRDWLMSLPLEAIDPVKSFFDNRPKVKINISYVRKDGKAVTREVSSIQDFFE